MVTTKCDDARHESISVPLMDYLIKEQDYISKVIINLSKVGC